MDTAWPIVTGDMQLYIRVRDDTHVIEAEPWWSAEDVLRRLPSEGGPFPLADVVRWRAPMGWRCVQEGM